MNSLSFQQLRQAVQRDAAIRVVTRLVPAGGPGDKVFPPTYATDKVDATKYAVEDRNIDGKVVKTVLLDSVASQANRMELAMQQAIDDGELEMPLVYVDFSDKKGVSDLGRISTLEAPHRIADAIFRDSVLDGVPFRASDLGRSFEDATPRNATPMYRICPHALVFGVWDSTGPKGGLGSKFQRVLTSEMVGVGAVLGKKTSSRIDPLQIQAAVDVYEKDDDDKKSWTLDPSEAVIEKKKPKKFGKEGNASEINHSNIAPSIDTKAGGVTIDYAIQTSVLSLVGLRQLSFPTTVDGRKLEGPERRDGQVAARTVLAALGLVALALARRQGYHLRSRALLVPEGPQKFELIGTDGGEPRQVTVSVDEALQLLRQAVDEARKFGFGWNTDSIRLEPADKLVELIVRSRELAATAKAEADNGGT